MILTPGRNRRRTSVILFAGLVTASRVSGPWNDRVHGQAPQMVACPAAPIGDALTGPMWNGWGADVANTRFQPASAARLTAADVPLLSLKWALGFPNGEFVASQPTVVGNRVYIGIGAGTGGVAQGGGGAYALDAESGCMYWSFKADKIVRTSITIGRLDDAGPVRYAAYLGDLQANVYAVDAQTGTHLWTRRVDMHPRALITAAPTLHNGRLYVPVSSVEEASASSGAYECCTFRGSVVAYDAATGHEIWRTYTIDEKPVPTRKNSQGTQQWGPAGAAVWNSPTIDVKRGVLYVATGDAYTAPASPASDAIIALDLETGRKKWVKQLLANDAWVVGCERTTNPSINCPQPPGPDYDFAQSPILRELPDGRAVLAIGQKSGVGWGLDPDKQGYIVWQHEVGLGSIRGGMVFGSAADERQVYFATSDIAHGPDRAGGLAAVNLSTGRRAWFVRPPAMTCEKPTDARCTQGQSAAVTAIPGVVFSGATNGIMRAYSTDAGRIIWEYDTVREYQTLNGLKARGGYIDGPGPTVVNGVLYMNSGYQTNRGGMPGNVLLAFAPSRPQ